MRVTAHQGAERASRSLQEMLFPPSQPGVLEDAAKGLARLSVFCGNGSTPEVAPRPAGLGNAETPHRRSCRWGASVSQALGDCSAVG